MDDNENKVTETEDQNQNQQQDNKENKENIVETIIQNGVSKEELAEMLKDILGKENTPDAAAVEAAEKEYFSSHLKY